MITLAIGIYSAGFWQMMDYIQRVAFWGALSCVSFIVLGILFLTWQEARDEKNRRG